MTNGFRDIAQNIQGHARDHGQANHDLTQALRDGRQAGLTLRELAALSGLSHEGVRQRLKERRQK